MSSAIRIDGKVAIVTGAGRGQGAATIALLRSAGAAVYGTDIDAEVGEAAAAAADATFLHHDVTDASSWDTVVRRVMADHGRVDVLVNNAGIIVWADMEATTPDIWQRVVAVNQTGPLLGMQAVAPIMKAQGGGSIVNISSVGGLGGSSPCFAYGATKWAVRGMTRGAAQELGPHGIRVNAILPGTVEGRMIEGMDLERVLPAIPLRRIATPDEIGRLTLWLASDESSYASGADFLLDGGMKA
jgi:3alpha(or 20beta)-hydroxysteroid dehydrogenase